MAAPEQRIDLDHNATTRVDPRVRAAMLPALEGLYGNPSSIHAAGRLARDAVERGRAEVAALLAAPSGGVVFTSGGTEADTWGIVAAARAARVAGRPARVVSSPLEHPAVHGALVTLRAEGFTVALVPVDSAGRIAPEDVTRAVGGEGAALVTLALANHELGNVYPIAAFAEAARRAGAGLVHCDAVQAAGKVPLDVTALGVDLLSVSAHKIHGPKGVGALWVRRAPGPLADLAPLVAGGHQERGLRPGTENVAGVVGFGVAARLAGAQLADMARVAGLRDRLEAGARAIGGARVHGDPAHRVPNTSNVAFAGAAGELVVMGLDLDGIAASTGAACTSGSLEPSPVVLALGEPRARAAEAVRFSLGHDNEDGDVDRLLAVLPQIVARVRAAR